METGLDGKDCAILRELERDASKTEKEIARKLGLPPTTVHNRIAKMEKTGVIRGYKAVVDYAKAGKPISAYVLMSLQFPADDPLHKKTLEKISACDEVEYADIVTGDADIVVKVHAQDTPALHSFIGETLRALKGVEKTVSWVVLQGMGDRKEGVLRK